MKFWILQITGALDIEEDPSQVSFPNPQICRELDKLKKEVDSLQEKCKKCHSKNPGGDQSKIPTLERGVDSLKRGLNATMDRLDQFLSHQKKDHAKIQEIQQALDVIRDELAAWAVHLQQQQQQQQFPCGAGENQNEVEEPYQTPTTVMTAMARKGDVVIEVTDPDRYPIGKFIVIQESLIYLVEGKGSLILERPLSRDFLEEQISVGDTHMGLPVDGETTSLPGVELLRSLVLRSPGSACLPRTERSTLRCDPWASVPGKPDRSAGRPEANLRLSSWSDVSHTVESV